MSSHAANTPSGSRGARMAPLAPPIEGRENREGSIMKTLVVGFVAVLGAGFATEEARAQAVGRPVSVATYPRPPYLAQVYWAPYGYRGASTAAGSYAWGVAAMTRAQGQYNLLSSQARIARAQARRYEMENRLRATEIYFQMRLVNKENRAKLRGPRPSSEDLERYAAAGRPARLSPSDFDHVTGEITWPVLLRDDRYADYRARLDALFAERAASDQLATDSHLSISRTAKAMLAALERRIGRVPQMDYIAAKRFIQSLAYEARQPAS